jgi:hypothetical protein
MKVSSFSSMGTIVQGFSKAYGLEGKMLEHHLKKEWPGIVGAPMANHTRPDSLKFRKLYLLAENSAWLQQLVFLKPVLLERIQAVTQASLVSDIVLRIGEFPNPFPVIGDGGLSQPPNVFPSADALAFATQTTSCIKDVHLQASLTQVIARAQSIGPQR